MRKTVERKLLILNELQWEHLEEMAAKKVDTPSFLAEFWRIGLGYSVEEWADLPAKSFKVWDYELSNTDHDRLYSLAIKSGKQSALAWVNIGPACVDNHL